MATGSSSLSKEPAAEASTEADDCFRRAKLADDDAAAPYHFHAHG